MGAKNNDSTLKNRLSLNFTLSNIESAAISTNKTIAAPCLGASAIPQSVDFRAFTVNVKTIAPIQKLYQSRHAIWWYVAPTIINTFLESYDLSGKTIIPFATSGGSGMGKTNESLQPSCPGATLLQGKMLNGRVSENELRKWLDGLHI